VPKPDPVPGPTAEQKQKLKRAFKLLACFAAVVAAVATLLVARGQAEFHLHMMIATALGMGLAVFIGGALMLLIFFSASSGHDDAASHYHSEDDE
jgi:hypothetical protein